MYDQERSVLVKLPQVVIWYCQGQLPCPEKQGDGVEQRACFEWSMLKVTLTLAMPLVFF